MANHEDRPMRDKVHLLLAFRRHKNNSDLPNECIRVVIGDYDLDLFLLEEKCKKLGGVWRIHHTVNARDTEKARKWLIHKLIDNPEFAGCIDSIWKTALLQKENATENNFLFDIDTTDYETIGKMWLFTQQVLIKDIRTPHGWHYVTKSFDAREVCKFTNVTLIRDGYYFIKEIK
jgi:hypothetical protein